ncbi:MAG: response regulator [Azoarcus sp.]|jgi:diguanylate cyclase (GGDEF)-like protein|nr:response regulator [Azoarcus sp.]
MNEKETGSTLPKILIVDDSRMVRASLSKQIRNRFSIREETDGEAGWEALLVDPEIQLVLTDLSMPRLDGFGLLDRIRGSRVQRIQEMPVVIISGDEDDEARNRALEHGASDFVSKGAGCAEMTARLESLLALSGTRRDLELSRSALATQSPVDPVSGLTTPAYLNHAAQQQIAQARRHHVAVSVMVVEIDHYEQLVDWHGSYVAGLITRKLSKVLAAQARREDTVTHLSEARFAVLSPSTALSGCCVFACRLQQAMEKLVMTYRDERIRITVTIGISGSDTDDARSVDDLVDTATARVRQGIAMGGRRVVGSKGEIDRQTVERYAKQAISIDHALLQLRIGAGEEVVERLPDIITAVMPLLELLEKRLHLDLPLDRLRSHGREWGK